MSKTTAIPLSRLRTKAARAALDDAAAWRVADIEALFALPFMDLLFRAQQVHREHFDASEVQLSTLLSIKTGGCPQHCRYCPQSALFHTSVQASNRMPLLVIVDAMLAAKTQVATCLFTGAY